MNFERINPDSEIREILEHCKSVAKIPCWSKTASTLSTSRSSTWKILDAEDFFYKSTVERNKSAVAFYMQKFRT